MVGIIMAGDPEHTVADDECAEVARAVSDAAVHGAVVCGAAACGVLIWRLLQGHSVTG